MCLVLRGHVRMFLWKKAEVVFTLCAVILDDVGNLERRLYSIIDIVFKIVYELDKLCFC